MDTKRKNLEEKMFDELTSGKWTSLEEMAQKLEYTTTSIATTMSIVVKVIKPWYDIERKCVTHVTADGGKWFTWYFRAVRKEKRSYGKR